MKSTGPSLSSGLGPGEAQPDADIAAVPRARPVAPVPIVLRKFRLLEFMGDFSDLLILFVYNNFLQV